VIVANDGAPGRVDAFRGDLAEPATVPAVAVSHLAGERLRAIATIGAPVRLAVHARTGTRRTSNVLAETALGDPGRVLVIGAHLDSVPEGPGINDDGSGLAVVLEIAVQLARLGLAPANRVRFAFWGSEELGLLGSRRYVDGLRPEERSRIAAVLNLDMVGSPNHGRFVHDGDGSAGGRAGPGGSAAIERVLLDYFEARGLPAEPTPLEGRSDYGPFMAAGIAVGGLYAGGPERKMEAQADLFGGVPGEPFDPCYHAACDTLGNVGPRAVEELGDAAAHAALALALDPALGGAGL
jgi:Zn-dependent M28 family amino/carboxypeptidase